MCGVFWCVGCSGVWGVLVCGVFWCVGCSGVWVFWCVGCSGVWGVLVCGVFWCVGCSGVWGVLVCGVFWCVGCSGVWGVLVCGVFWCVGCSGVWGVLVCGVRVRYLHSQFQFNSIGVCFFFSLQDSTVIKTLMLLIVQKEDVSTLAADLLIKVGYNIGYVWGKHVRSAWK